MTKIVYRIIMVENHNGSAKLTCFTIRVYVFGVVRFH